MASDDELRAKLTEALMKREGCERLVEDHFTSYCTEHYVGWLHDVNACAHSAVNVEIALIPAIREALADAWDEGYDEHEAPHSIDRRNPWRKDQP